MDRKPMQDQPSWFIGLRSSLRHVFGTNTELRLKQGGARAAIHVANQAVTRMTQEAEDLMEALQEGYPIDDIEVALEAIVKDLD